MENLSISSKGATKILSDNTSTTEVSEEFILADYIPEIRRLLGIKSQALPESRYVQGDKLELGGAVTYLVTYTDDDGELCGTSLSSSYNMELPFIEGAQDLFLTTVDNVNVRVNGPRRLTIKARLKTRLQMLGTEQIKEQITPKSTADEMFLEREALDRESFEIQKCTLDGIRMSDRLYAPENESVKPLWCDAYIVITDTKSQNGSVSVRGKVKVKCVCQGSEGIITLERELPLAEEIECESCKTGDSTRVTGRCVSLSISNEASESTNQLFFDIDCELECQALKRYPLKLTKDCYSTRYETEAVYQDKELYSVVKMANSSFTLNDTVKQKNGEITEIIEKIATPVLEKADIKGSKMILSGKVQGAIIGKGKADENGNSEYTSLQMELPFKYECDLGKAVEEPIIFASLDMGDMLLTGEGEKINATVEIYPAFTVYEKTRERILDSMVIKKDKEIKKDGAVVTAFFPKDSDTLWEIAKRFHTTTKKIEEDNESTDGAMIIL